MLTINSALRAKIIPLVTVHVLTDIQFTKVAL